MIFDEISPNPVDQVQCTVRAQRKQIVTSNTFCFARFADEEQLRQYGHRFQIDGECPEHFQYGEFMVDNQWQYNARYQQEFYSKWIVIAIVGCTEFGEY